MIVDSALYRDGHRVTPGPAIADLRKAAEADDFAWVGLHDPTQEELGEVADVFDLHPLAVEDALTAHQRPKLEHYDRGFFLVLKTLWYVDEDDSVETGEVNIFLGPGYMVTVRHGSGGQLAPARRFLESQHEILREGPSSAVYAVADLIVDEYLDVIGSLSEDVDEVETSVFSDQRTSDSARIYRLKRELAEVRRAVLPLREPIRRFAAGEIPHIDDDLQPYFRDVLDHLNIATENALGLDNLLSSAFEAYLAQLSLQQNDDMRKISAGAALVVVPTLIAGIYGMNFTHMPELDWTYGYGFALLLMVATVTGLWILFRRSGWF